MRIPRVYLPQSVRGGEEVELPLEEGHHLARVLRRRPGDRVVLVSQAGGIFEGQIASAEEREGSLRIVVSVLSEVEARSLLPLIPWTVAAAVVKGESFELALRMAVELGLERLIPLWTERTVVRVRQGSMKLHRWERIVREASKQCGRGEPLELGAPRKLADFLEESPALPSQARRWVAFPLAPFHPEELAAGLDEGGDDRLAPALFLVGPEGGLSPGEISQSIASGFRPIGFPTPVLRTPTAVALIAALGAILGGAVER